MDYTQACSMLRTAARLGSRPGLANISRLCALLGDPQNKLRTVHVAGTNGKGSTCAMLACMGAEAGYKTGLFTSPFFEDYRESLLINGRMVSKDAFARSFCTVHEKARIMEAEGNAPTEFELLTACAFVCFLREGCTLVILEAGMGGRLDATNVVSSPLACVICAISLDHTAYLGETPLAIAAEKCGIIKEGRPVVAYPDQPPGVLRLIRKTAREKNAPFFLPSSAQLHIDDAGLFGTRFTYQNAAYQTAMPGAHQVKNAALALEAVHALARESGVRILQSAAASGLEKARLPARQEVFCQKPLILLDGAHNLQGICALAETAAAFVNVRPVAVVMGMLADKQYEQSIAQMAPAADLFVATTPQNPRALPAQDTATCALPYAKRISLQPDIGGALKEALLFAGENGAVIVCGSLYVALAARRLLQNKK